MKNKSFNHYALIVAFLGVAVIFFSNSQATIAQFLIFLFSGILIGINIMKIKNSSQDA
ncbi:MAG: hypothetical protein KAS35_00230 [Candidatus Marinimicrobia bacterium]|nr:hypothetical protein [Candidatus Neomarinimicrobiota bacterium]